MANIKTAISIEKPLFEEIEELALKMKVSRSRLFTLAARAFIQSHKNQRLLEAINAAYMDPSADEDEKLRGRMKSRYLQLVKESW